MYVILLCTYTFTSGLSTDEVVVDVVHLMLHLGDEKTSGEKIHELERGSNRELARYLHIHYTDSA